VWTLFGSSIPDGTCLLTTLRISPLLRTVLLPRLLFVDLMTCAPVGPTPLLLLLLLSFGSIQYIRSSLLCIVVFIVVALLLLLLALFRCCCVVTLIIIEYRY